MNTEYVADGYVIMLISSFKHLRGLKEY